MEACDKKMYSYIQEIENLIGRMKHLNSVIDSKSYGKSTNKIKGMIEDYQHKMQQEKKIVAKMASVLETATVVYQNTENEAYKEITGKNYRKVTRDNNKVDADKAKASQKEKYRDSKLNDNLYKKEKKPGSNGGNAKDNSNKNGRLSGSAAMNKAIDWAIKTAKNDYHEYRYGAGHGAKESRYYDCSGFVCHALKAAGFNINAVGTSDMRAELEKAGFEWIPWSKINGTKNLKSGDVLLRLKTSGRCGHTEMYIGNNQMVGAHESPQYIVSSNVGVTGASSISVTQYKNKSWAGVLRYKGK